MYWRKGYGPVLEIIAHWDKKPRFIEEAVEPDSSLDYLLDSPREAFLHIFSDNKQPRDISEAEWKNHIFCQKCVIAELCAWTNPQRGYLDILEELLGRYM